jgi:hypothetical protein
MRNSSSNLGPISDPSLNSSFFFFFLVVSPIELLLNLGVFFCYKYNQVTFDPKSNLIGDEKFEFKFLSHFNYFFCYKNYRTTFGRKNNSTHEELKLGSQFKPKLELGFFSFFFVAGVIELLLRPKVVQ